MGLTDHHAAWGLAGWVGFLLMGVAFQVIPMFQSTPLYPRVVEVWLVPTMAGVLATWSFTGIAGAVMPAGTRAWLALLLSIGYAAFALVTLVLLQRRTRPKPEATTLFWRLAMASLLVCTVLYVVPGFDNDQRRPLILGILFIVGCATSAVNGMLYKIVPFLLWYHLQSRSGLDRKSVPNIKALLPERASEQQFWLHLAALALLLGTALAPHALARPAAVVFGFSSVRLCLNLMQAGVVYRRAIARAVCVSVCG
jgi:hypothetical protein